MQTGLLGYVVVALSSECDDVRYVAYQVIGRFYEKLFVRNAVYIG
jgi:hypothetical protein